MVNIKNMDFAYKKTKLFSNLSLELKPGNIYGLLGKNGAGKTSLLKIISGLLFPNTGKIEVNNFIPKQRNPEFLQDIFFLPEEYYLPGLKAIDFKKVYAPFYTNFDNVRFMELLEEFKLPMDQKLNSFSYGQKKKFLISFGIACNSRIFLLDEPTNGLDIPSKTQFRRIIASAGTENRLIIISTHQVRDMENLIDPIIIVDEGKVIFNEYVEQVTNKLTVKKLTEEPAKDTVLYLEKEIDGYKAVMANTDQDQIDIDFETLFNTVISNPSGVKSVFNGGTNNENN
ncbi:MAG: ABC transporter ATP-binding protein [Spirochaetia bacterium]|jgi:ABC-2 type transport system ATP-binding protein|nr:ABC transporter ATP-binding protein [Spirochaetia bacterium]